MKDNFSQYIAVDLGAESGRVMLGSVSDNNIELAEIHRFSNGPVQQNDSLRWDFEKLFSEIKTGIAAATKTAKGKISGIAVDSWGVDFGLIGDDGSLLENPYHYRDARTNGIMEKVFDTFPKREVYENTGIQFMQLNTIFQLFAAKSQNPDILKKTKKLIFMADLVSYFLCGNSFAEYTLASTSQLMNMKTGKWSKEIFENLSLPIEIMPQVVIPGSKVGLLKPEICKEFNCDPIDVFAVGSHDTASAVAAVPASGNNWAYLSSGTWSLIGIETKQAIINDDSFAGAFTNEGGVENTIRFLKNIMGLWLLQECRRDWEKQGCKLDYTQITNMAKAAKPFAAKIDCNNPDFLAPGQMPERINQHLKNSGQQPITDKGQMTRAILESLAAKYRDEMQTLEKITGKKIDTLHIVGGGSKNDLLNQFAADATGKTVITGPVEATAIGNILMQAVAKGQIKNIADARQIVRQSFECRNFTPAPSKP
ncbi:MAG: Rhamnulokinase [Planctomycetes bacterium ADurb.Bin401]|nr:MAG: Rhamnulokinase [Planctomycetes bacterium ADurb.Bin401]